MLAYVYSPALVSPLGLWSQSLATILSATIRLSLKLPES